MGSPDVTHSDHLFWPQGFGDVSVLDVSAVALEALHQRLGVDSPVTFIHFLVEDTDRRAYLSRLHQVRRAGGYLIVGTFASDGPQHCSGLPVARYAPEALSEFLGTDFEVLEHRREEHVTAAGAVQPFTWLAARLRG